MMQNPEFKEDKSDEPGKKADPFARYHELTIDDVITFFDEVAPEAKCPICGNDDLLVHAGVGFDSEGQPHPDVSRFAMVGMVVHEIPSKGATIKQAAITSSCPRCGHLSYFLADNVLKWKKSNGSEG